MKPDLKKDIVSSIISAANRKVHMKHKPKPAQVDKPVDEPKESSSFAERDIDYETEVRSHQQQQQHQRRRCRVNPRASAEKSVELPDPKPMS